MIKKHIIPFIIFFVITSILLYFINYRWINNINRKNSRSYLISDLKKEYKDYFNFADEAFFEGSSKVYLEYNKLNPEEIIALNVIVYGVDINDDNIKREINNYLVAKGESKANYLSYKDKVSENINKILDRYEYKRRAYLRKPFIDIGLSSLLIAFLLTCAYTLNDKKAP